MLKDLTKTLLISGLIVIVYAVFSRFYGRPSVAMSNFKSSNVFMVGNTLLLLALIAKKK